MPELPEIYVKAKQMDKELTGKVIVDFNIIQPKSLNIPEESFIANLLGAEIQQTTYKGKWLFVQTSQGYLLINLGMGGELILCTSETLPEKHRMTISFEDGDMLSINFWWFGYVHYVRDLVDHDMTAKLGENAIDITEDEFASMLVKKKGGIKSFLLNQKNIAGIGNAYIHDILFMANIHPLRKIPTLDRDDLQKLYRSIIDGLMLSVNKGAAFYEVDLYGNKGGFEREDIIIGYREGQPCPTCNTTIEKIKTGSTASYICSQCQPI